MKRIVFIFMLFMTSQTFVHAQKHAPQTNLRRVDGIYPEGSTRLLKYSDIQGLTTWDLKIMRNEIFARKGFIFKSEDMKVYFNETSWYNPRYNSVDKLFSNTEKRNIAYIKTFE